MLWQMLIVGSIPAVIGLIIMLGRPHHPDHRWFMIAGGLLGAVAIFAQTGFSLYVSPDLTLQRAGAVLAVMVIWPLVGEIIVQARGVMRRRRSRRLSGGAGRGSHPRPEVGQ